MQKAKADNKVLDLIKKSKVGVDAGKMKARHLARLRLEHRDGPEDDANLPEDRTNALPISHHPTGHTDAISTPTNLWGCW